VDGGWFLADYLIIYIEKDIGGKFSIDMIIYYLYFMKERQTQLK
jgi:hypothetical protein